MALAICWHPENDVFRFGSSGFQSDQIGARVAPICWLGCGKVLFSHVFSALLDWEMS